MIEYEHELEDWLEEEEGINFFEMMLEVSGVPIDEFIKWVECGHITDDDGVGYVMRNGSEYGPIRLDKVCLQNYKQSGITHIAWYNK